MRMKWPQGCRRWASPCTRSATARIPKELLGKSLYAVGNRTHSKGVAFAEKYGIGKVYGTIDEMFTDDNVDIIYITSPQNTHYGFMKKALENGKHLLVEKSITLNSQELDEMRREVDHSQFAGARRDDRAREEQGPHSG